MRGIVNFLIGTSQCASPSVVENSIEKFIRFLCVWSIHISACLLANSIVKIKTESIQIGLITNYLLQAVIWYCGESDKKRVLMIRLKIF